MAAGLLLAAALGAAAADPISAASARYQAVDSYQVTLRASGNRGNAEIIRYFYKKPGFVRMEFIQPFRGAVLIYSPVTQEVRLRPFGTFSFPVFTLSAENRLVQSAGGHRVDRSDVGALLRNVKALQAHGTTEVLGEESVNGRKTQHIAVTGRNDFSVEGVHRYDLWLDTATLWPLKTTSRDAKNRLIETVVMEDLQINAALPDALFSQ